MMPVTDEAQSATWIITGGGIEYHIRIYYRANQTLSTADVVPWTAFTCVFLFVSALAYSLATMAGQRLL